MSVTCLHGIPQENWHRLKFYGLAPIESRCACGRPALNAYVSGAFDSVSHLCPAGIAARQARMKAFHQGAYKA